MTIYVDRAPQLAGSVIALVAVASVTFALRIYTRLSNGAFGIDDWSMALAMVSETLLLSP